jgi:hypothetical protein
MGVAFMEASLAVGSAEGDFADVGLEDLASGHITADTITADTILTRTRIDQLRLEGSSRQHLRITIRLKTRRFAGGSCCAMPNRHDYALGLRSQSLQMTCASSRGLIAFHTI